MMLKRRLIIGINSTQQCLEEIAQSKTQYPDFIHLKPPHDIDKVDNWVNIASSSPLLSATRSAFIEDAHHFSETGWSRMLDILESPIDVGIWISAQTIPPHTILSRMQVLCSGNEAIATQSLLLNCKNHLVGNTSPKLWEEWFEVIRLLKMNLPGCVEAASKFSVCQK